TIDGAECATLPLKQNLHQCDEVSRHFAAVLAALFFGSWELACFGIRCFWNPQNASSDRLSSTAAADQKIRTNRNNDALNVDGVEIRRGCQRHATHSQHIFFALE